MLGNKGCDAGGPTWSSACPGHMTHKHTALFSWSTTLLFPGCVFEYPRPTAAYTDHTAAVIRLALKWPRCCRISVQPPEKGRLMDSDGGPSHTSPTGAESTSHEEPNGERDEDVAE